MNAAARALDQARRAGFVLALVDGVLDCEATLPADEGIVAALRPHRQEIVAILDAERRGMVPIGRYISLARSRGYGVVLKAAGSLALTVPSPPAPTITRAMNERADEVVAWLNRSVADPT